MQLQYAHRKFLQPVLEYIIIIHSTISTEAHEFNLASTATVSWSSNWHSFLQMNTLKSACDGASITKCSVPSYMKGALTTMGL